VIHPWLIEHKSIIAKKYRDQGQQKMDREKSESKTLVTKKEETKKNN
jgi:hypothetical protein